VSYSAPVDPWILGDPLEDITQDIMALVAEWDSAEPSEWRGDDSSRRHTPLEFAQRATAYAVARLRSILEHGPGAWIRSSAGHNRVIPLDDIDIPSAPPNLTERLEASETLVQALGKMTDSDRLALESTLAWVEGRHDFVVSFGDDDDAIGRTIDPDEVEATQCGPTRRHARRCAECGTLNPLTNRRGSKVEDRIGPVLRTAVLARHRLALAEAERLGTARSALPSLQSSAL
jgi:hypothetical protein